MASVAVPAGAAMAQSAPSPDQSKPAAQPDAPAQPASRPASKAPAPKADPKAAPDATTVKGVTVTATSADMRTAIDRRSYDVTKDLQATSGSISDALRNIPSVEVDVNGNVSLRGDANVKILIDGKPSGQFTGAATAQSLQQMPAGQIERVEVITNPSAEFSPDGSAGIINLVTKKTRKSGKTGGARVQAAPGGRWNGGANIAWRGKKLTVAADANIRHDRQSGVFTADTEGTDPLSGLGFSQHSQGDNHNINDFRSLHASVDYDIAPKTRVSGDAHYNQFEGHNTGESSFTNSGPTGVVTQAFSRDDASHFDRSNGGATGTWRRTFAGDDHDLTISLRSEQTRLSSDDRYTDHHPIPAAPDQATDRRSGDNQLETQLKADYVRPMGGESKLKAGYDLQVTSDRFDNSAEIGPSLAALAPDPTQTDHFNFDQTIQALYTTYEQPMGKFTVLGGLRLESVVIHTNDVTSHQSNHNDYVRLYPTLHLGYKIDDKQQLTASYSQRVNRPFGQDFNPFRVMNSAFSFSSGNPNLQPQQTQSWEAGYQYRNAGTFYLATLYYRQNRNGVTDVVTDLGGGVLLNSKANLASSRSAGLELVANGKLTKTISYNISSNTFWNETDATSLGFSTRSAWVVSGRGNINWQMTPKDLLQVNGFMSGKQLSAQGHRNSFGLLNLGYRHKFNDNLSMVATLRDALKSARFGQTVDTAVLRTQSEFVPQIRTFFIGLTYTYGGRNPRGDQFDYGNPGG
jgi:outer membrane receptor protein involved in Fe transport